MSRSSIDKPYSQHWKGRFGMNHAQDGIRNEKLENIDTKLFHDATSKSVATILNDISTNNNTNNAQIISGITTTNTNLTTMDGVLDDILVKNTEIDTVLDSIDTKMTALTTGSNSHQNLYSNGSLLANNFSTTIDMSNHRSISIFGQTTSTTATLYLAFSTDNVNYYIATSLSMYLQNLNGTYYFGNNFHNIGSKYIRVYTTHDLTNLYMSASFKN